MSLLKSQSQFWELVAGGGEADRLSAHELVVGQGALTPAVRIGIYANMFLWRQVDALREDFPRLVSLLGDEVFFELAAAYLKAEPSRAPSLSELGGRLEGFLRSGRHVLARPDCADLAALEWLRTRIFEEADGQPLPPETLSQLPPERIGGAVLRFIPALATLDLEYDAVKLWQQLGDSEDIEVAERAPTHVVVWRKDFMVFHASLGSAEAQALELARRGATFAEFCEAFAGEPEPVQAALSAVGSWFVEGWILALEG